MQQGTARRRDGHEHVSQNQQQSLFAEAQRRAQIVNGRSKKLGLINGRWAMLWPWAFILVLSLVGFAIGLVDAFGDAASSGAARGAATVLAVFGLMMVMSVYFIITRASESE